MLRLSLALAATAMLTAPVNAATQCRNPKTQKFMTCPPAPAAASGVTKDRNGKCHIASGKNKGKFTPCPKA